MGQYIHYIFIYGILSYDIVNFFVGFIHSHDSGLSLLIIIKAEVCRIKDSSISSVEGYSNPTRGYLDHEDLSIWVGLEVHYHSIPLVSLYFTIQGMVLDFLPV